MHNSAAVHPLLDFRTGYRGDSVFCISCQPVGHRHRQRSRSAQQEPSAPSPREIPSGRAGFRRAAGSGGRALQIWVGQPDIDGAAHQFPINSPSIPIDSHQYCSRGGTQGTLSGLARRRLGGSQGAVCPTAPEAIRSLTNKLCATQTMWQMSGMLVGGYTRRACSLPTQVSGLRRWKGTRPLEVCWEASAAHEARWYYGPPGLSCCIRLLKPSRRTRSQLSPLSCWWLERGP